MGHREQGRGERIGHLILHHLGCLARIFGVDNHLHIREIRNGIQRSAPQGIATHSHDQQGHGDDEERIV